MKILFLILMTFNIYSQTETIVLLHGYSDDAKGTKWFANKLKVDGHDIIQIEYPSFRNSINLSQKVVAEKINECCANLEGKVHFVGHSAGALLIRSYLQDNQVQNLGRVVSLGGPNKGTPYVDLVARFKLTSVIGPFAKDLGIAGSEFLDSLEPPYYPIGVIAGTLEIPLTSKLIPGPNDGLIQVDSTKIDGMADFTEIKVNHIQMKYSKKVIHQTLHFIKNGEFDHGQAFESIEEELAFQ